jgi:hypothetical protein
MVLVIDAFDRVCKENPRFAIQLQDFAKDRADNSSLRVVFVFSRDEALPLLTSRSAWTRAMRPFEVSGIPDADAINFLLDHHVEQSRVQDAVHTITGGRFSLLLRFVDASAAMSNSVFREQLDIKARTDLGVANVQLTHPLYAKLLSSGRLGKDQVAKYLNPAQRKQLLVDNILTAHADETYSFRDRHVSAFFKGVCAFFIMFLTPPVRMLSPVHVDMTCLIILRNVRGLAEGQAAAVADAIRSHTHSDTLATSHLFCWASDCRAE